MSAFYLLGVIVVWLTLTTLLWKSWRKTHQDAGVKRRGIDAVFAVAMLAWLAVSFWYGGGRKYYYDAEVNRLCRMDGGVKVYETVKLPADKFDKWGQINFYKPTQGESTLGPEYVFKQEIAYYRQDDPDMFRLHTRVLRRLDGRLLGESVFYKRGGGDLPGPWHGSTFMCPEPTAANDVLRQVFVKE